MYIRKEIREFMKKMPKEMKLPKHWRKFVNENSSECNLIIKQGKQYECTHCHKTFNSNAVVGAIERCPFCRQAYIVKNHNLKNYREYFNLALIDNICNRIVIRIFEVESSYNYQKRIFENDVAEYARIVPEFGVELVNDRFIKYLGAEYVCHTSRIEKWRVFSGYYGINRSYSAMYGEGIEEKLKGTVYEYAPIQETIEYLILKNEKINVFRILEKAKYHSFELLVKAKLYKLALDCPEKFNSKGNFEKRFGVSKDYYGFMKKHDISYQQLRVLQLTKRPNIDKIERLLRISNNNLEKLEKASKYVDLIKLEEYSKKQKNFSIYSYLDYIRNLEKLEIPLKGKKILFPEDFWKAHDESVKKVKVVGNIGLDKRIKKRYEQLSKNSYNDNIYFIRPAKTLEDMKSEANQQHNCVYKNYSEDYAFGDTDIYFLRDIKSPKKSLVTIEVNNNKVVQSRVKYNNSPTKEQNEFIKKWENEILKVA